MAVPAVGRCVCGGWPRGGVPATGVPVVHRAAGVLVGVSAVCPGGGRCQRIFVPRLRCGRCRVTHALLPAFVLAWRLDAAEAVGTVIAEVAGAAGGVRPALPGWRSLIRRRGGGRGGSPPAFRSSGSRSRRWQSSSAGRRSPAGGSWPVCVNGDRCRFRCGLLPAGLAGAGGVAVRVGGERREADRGQQKLALPDRRQTAFHASCPAITGMRRQRAWTTGSKRKWRCTAGR